MNLAEGRRSAESEGTARWEKFKKTGKKTVWILTLIIGLGLVTYWTVGAINSPTQQASDPTLYQAPPSTNPEVYRAAVAKEQSSDKCPGKVVVLDKSNPSRSVPGPWCLFHYKVVTGTFKIDGTDGDGRAATPLTLTPQGATVSDNQQFYARHAQLASLDGEMQVLECPTGSVIRNWKCWDR